MPDLPLVALKRLVTALDDGRVPYAIIGGVAVSIRAVPRYTSDVDAVVWIGESGWSELLDLLTRHGFAAKASDPIGFAHINRLLLMTDEDGVEIDISFGALPFEEDMIRNAEPIEVSQGCIAPVATSRALVIMKAIAWRSKDRQDIREIVAINPDIDWDSVVDEFAEYAELLNAPERTGQLNALIRESL